MSSYNDLSDEDKVELAIKFVAQNQPLPETLRAFLVANDLHDKITNPGIIEEETYANPS